MAKSPTAPMPVRVKFTGPKAKTQMAIDVTDFLRKKGYLVASTYEDPDEMRPQAQVTYTKLLMDADVVVECF